MCINGLTISVNTAIATTYRTILTSAPYDWLDSSISYVNFGQIIVALIALPLLGTDSDTLIKWFARRNGGIHEPETSLPTFSSPGHRRCFYRCSLPPGNFSSRALPLVRICVDSSSLLVLLRWREHCCDQVLGRQLPCAGWSPSRNSMCVPRIHLV